LGAVRQFYLELFTMKKVWKKVKGWGNYPSVKAEVITPASVEEVQEVVLQKNTLLARGSGYSYGDSSLHPIIISTKKLNNILAQGKDWIEVEAGVTIAQLLQHIVPQQQFLLVTPGTKGVTIGGAIASDVHGKNHSKEGSFFNTTVSLKLVDKEGKLVACSREQHAELFYACFGGMGLQGVIISAVIRLMPLPSQMMMERQYIAASLPEVFTLMQQYQQAPYLVGWLDLLSKEVRGVVKTGEWNTQAKKTESVNGRRISIPFVFPVAPPRFFFKWYNGRYIAHAQKRPMHTIHFNRFFYPLDSIRNWRYVFGKKGLLQYHFLLPLHVSEAGIAEVVGLVKSSGATCTLAVLKLFGQKNEETPHAFTQGGFNLALDFIYSKSAINLIHLLDKKIHALGGAVYKTKDAVSQLPQSIKTGKFQSMQNQRYERTSKG
jgi:decaprenylphospho-beta-D-ribofuranose 2-oxidase